MIDLIYASTANYLMTDADLKAILDEALANNDRLGGSSALYVEGWIW